MGPVRNPQSSKVSEALVGDCDWLIHSLLWVWVQSNIFLAQSVETFSADEVINFAMCVCLSEEDSEEWSQPGRGSGSGTQQQDRRQNMSEDGGGGW